MLIKHGLDIKPYLICYLPLTSSQSCKIFDFWNFPIDRLEKANKETRSTRHPITQVYEISSKGEFPLLRRQKTSQKHYCNRIAHFLLNPVLLKRRLLCSHLNCLSVVPVTAGVNKDKFGFWKNQNAKLLYF